MSINIETSDAILGEAVGWNEMTDCQNAADMQSGSDDYKNVFNEVEEEKGNKEELLASEEIATDSVNSTESWWILFCFAPLIYYSVSSLFSPVL